MENQLEKLAETVEDMILQLSYPGFEERSLKLSLPDKVNKFPARVFAQALKHESAVVKLASLRWFQERPGMAKSHLKSIIDCLSDSDEWVRLEGIHCLEKYDTFGEEVLRIMAALLKDESIEVRKASAKALGKVGGKSELVIEALKVAAEDQNHELRWKAQKALRKLGAYVV